MGRLTQSTKVLCLLAISSLLSLTVNGETMLPDEVLPNEVLPDDVDPVTRSRLPLIEKQSLDADGRRIYALVAGGAEGSIPTSGPGLVSMHSPTVAESMHIINTYLRSEEAILGPRLTEVAILVAAWEFEQQYEWTFHEPAARRFGVPDAVIDTIKYDRDVVDLGREESLIIRYSRQVLREHKLDSKLWAEAVELFGRQGAFEIAAVVGDYIMAAVMLEAADQHLPEGTEPLLPER